MANTTNRPKGRSLSNLRMVWGFTSHYPAHIATAALALLCAAAATFGSATHERLATGVFAALLEAFGRQPALGAAARVPRVDDIVISTLPETLEPSFLPAPPDKPAEPPKLTVTVTGQRLGSPLGPSC